MIKSLGKPLAVLVALAASSCFCQCTIAQGTFPGAGSKADWLKANGFFAEGNQLKEVKKFAEAIAKYNEAIAIYGSDSHYYYNLGVAQRSSGDTAAAVASFRHALQLNSRDWKAWKALANCLYRDGQFAEAKDAFQHALNSAPPPKEVAELRKGVAACGARAH